MTATKAQLGLGTVITKDVGTGDTVIAEVTTITGPTTSADQVDVTSQESASGFREFIRGLVDPGTVTFDLFYDGTDTSHKALMADISSTDTPEPWKMVFPDTTELTFAAKTNGFEFTVPVDGALTVSVTLQVSGAITYPT